MKSWLSSDRKLFHFVNAISIFMLIVVVYQYFQPSIERTSNRGLVFLFLRDYIFFNSLHVPIAFFLIFYIPNFKIFVNSQRSRIYSLKTEIFFAFVIFFVISFFGWQFGEWYAKDSRIDNVNTFLVYQIVFMLLTAFHGIGQVYGISMIISKSKAKAQEKLLNEKIEKRLFQILPVLFFVCLTAMTIRSIDFELYVIYKLFFRICFYLLCIVCGSIFVNSFFSAKEIRRDKVLFLSRVLLIPFVGFVPLASFATQLNHGIEYMVVIKNIVEKQENKKFVIQGLVVVCILWGVLCIPRYVSFKGHFDIVYLTAYLALLTAVDLSHYRLDRILFRMRIPKSRELIGPLLKFK